MLIAKATTAHICNTNACNHTLFPGLALYVLILKPYQASLNKCLQDLSSFNKMLHLNNDAYNILFLIINI